MHATFAEVLGTSAPPLPALVRLLDDEQAVVRQNSAVALGAHGTRSPLVVPALIHALADRDHDIRSVAADRLARTGPAAMSAAAPLARIVANKGV